LFLFSENTKKITLEVKCKCVPLKSTQVEVDFILDKYTLSIKCYSISSQVKVNIMLRRRSVCQSFLVSNIHLGPKTRFLWDALSDEKTVLSFKIAAGPRQRSHSQFRACRTHERILLPQIRDPPQPAGLGLHICIPQKGGGSDIPTDIGFPFRRLLRLEGLRWRFSN
jgi:hypothetical protein